MGLQSPQKWAAGQPGCIRKQMSRLLVGTALWEETTSWGPGWGVPLQVPGGPGLDTALRTVGRTCCLTRSTPALSCTPAPVPPRPGPDCRWFLPPLPRPPLTHCPACPAPHGTLFLCICTRAGLGCHGASGVPAPLVFGWVGLATLCPPALSLCSVACFALPPQHHQSLGLICILHPRQGPPPPPRNISNKPEPNQEWRGMGPLPLPGLSP